MVLCKIFALLDFYIWQARVCQQTLLVLIVPRFFGVSEVFDEHTCKKRSPNHTFPFFVFKPFGSRLRPSWLHLNLQRVLRSPRYITFQNSIPIDLFRELCRRQVLIYQRPRVAISNPSEMSLWQIPLSQHWNA